MAGSGVPQPLTDAEVFQEILHRYAAIPRRDAIEPAWRALAAIVDEVLPIELEHVATAKAMLLETRALSSRDALHLAVMEASGFDRILSFDQGYDRRSSVHRVA